MFFKNFMVMDARRLLGIYGVLGMIRWGFLPRSLADNFAKQAGVDLFSRWMWLALMPTSRLLTYTITLHILVTQAFLQWRNPERGWADVAVSCATAFLAALISASMINYLVSRLFKKEREIYHAFEFHFGYLIMRCLPDAILPNGACGQARPLSPAQFTDCVMRGIGFFAEMSVIATVTYGEETRQVEVARAHLKGVLEQAFAAGLIRSDGPEHHEAEAVKRLKVFIQRQSALDSVKVKTEVILPPDETSEVNHQAPKVSK